MLIPVRQKKNTALTLVFPLTDADGQPITGAAALDSERSQDGGAFADCTNEAAEMFDGTVPIGWYALTLTATELNYGVISVRVQTSTVGIMPLAFMLTTYTEPLDDANTELASVPTTISGLRTMLQYVFEYFRNKRTATSAVETLFKEDASTALGTAALSDDATTFTKGEMS